MNEMKVPQCSLCLSAATNCRRFVMAKFGALVLPRPEAPREVKLLEEMGFDVALIPDSQPLAREVYVTLTACVEGAPRLTAAVYASRLC
jgi:hypothetical protein